MNRTYKAYWKRLDDSGAIIDHGSYLIIALDLRAAWAKAILAHPDAIIVVTSERDYTSP